jgi:hypothetical protein
MTDFDIYSRTPVASPPTDGATSFDVYNKQPQPAPAAPEVGYAEDIAKGTAGGLGRGVAGLIGLPGDIAEYGARGIDWATRKVGGALGVDVAPREDRAPTYGSADVTKALESYTGPLYQPKTIPGQYASTIAEFAPGALIPGGAAGSAGRRVAAKTLNTVVPAITSETAGQLTKDTPYEPYARLVGGLLGGVAGAKAVTPIRPASPAYQHDVTVLERAGIPLTAGKRTGSRPLQWFESNAVDMPAVGGQAARLQNRASEGLNRAVTERVYDPAELAARGVPAGVHLPDSRVAVAGPASLSDNYTRLTQAPFVTNPQFQNRMTRAQNEYERLVLPSDRTARIENTQNDIIDRLVAGRGRMGGDEYQSIRSQIAKAQRAAGINPQEQRALTEYKRALDEAYMAGLNPRDAAALALNNRRYALMKQIEPAVASAGENLSPAKLAQVVRSRRNAQYAARSGDLDELAAAAGTVMKPLPNSGTAARLGARQVGSGGVIGTTVGGIVGGFPGAAIGAGIGAATPLVPSYLATSRLGQAYLGNRALPQNMRDVLAQTLAQQAISQPGGVARNHAARDEYEKKRKALQRVYVMEK